MMMIYQKSQYFTKMQMMYYMFSNRQAEIHTVIQFSETASMIDLFAMPVQQHGFNSKNVACNVKVLYFSGRTIVPFHCFSSVSKNYLNVQLKTFLWVYCNNDEQYIKIERNILYVSYIMKGNIMPWNGGVLMILALRFFDI